MAPTTTTIITSTTTTGSNNSEWSEKLPEALEPFEKYFHLSDERLLDIVKHFRGEMDDGLASYGKDVAMVPSFVTGVPDGTEQG